MIKSFNYYRFRFILSEYIFIFFILELFYFSFLFNNVSFLRIIFFLIPLFLIFYIRKLICNKVNFNEKIIIDNKKIIFPKNFNNLKISHSQIKKIKLNTKINIISLIFMWWWTLIIANNSINNIIFEMKNGKVICLSNRNIDINDFSKELYYLHYDDLFEKNKIYSIFR